MIIIESKLTHFQ